ncbi:DUF2254 domain-containing protein [Mycetocola zhujimingii]|uniref:DUF2254 domain-containing protein n=1 Tax=Mycetocola zhujimingii TaxID=2079792 RepID=UPI000D3A7BD9|nr:DUF2254 domain-containing protein [Mycetocola zhujimingii]AWB86167.1 DUF2254 domain-containing protein [Mycetocola zhujimingii]
MKRRAGSSEVRDSLRTQLWPVPLAAAIAAVVLGQFLPFLDRQLENNLSDAVSGLLFGGGPEAAQALMQTIAGSLVTVTSLTFSLTVVTLQLASSQFSPRLLRTFSRDRFVHTTLGLFLATFLFSLTVLRSIRSETSEGDGFVPKISITLAFGLTVASVIALVFFLGHLATQIRVETMMRDVHSEADEAIARIFPEDGSPEPEPVLSPEWDAAHIESPVSGFLLGVDVKTALAAAIESDTFVVIDAVPGASLIAGVPFARAWALDRAPIDDERKSVLSLGLGSSLSTGFERTSTQDAGFGLQQLLDVASRALSHGVNDPTTAVHAIGHISALLCSLAGLRTGPKFHADEEGRPRVVVGYPTFEDLLDQAMVQMRTYALDDPRTAGRVVRMLRELSWVVRQGPQSAALGLELDLLRAEITTAHVSPQTKELLLRDCAAVTAASRGSWLSP